MAIVIRRIDGRYEAEVTPPHGGATPWKSPVPLRRDEMVRALLDRGCHQTDIGDAFSEADPEWSLRDDESPTEPAGVSELDAYLGRVRGLLISIADRLTPLECGEVEHLIEHGEPAEGMRALAWIIVEGDKKVPAEAISTLLALTSGLIADEHMPPGLDKCIG